MLNQQLKTVREATMNILVDKELYAIFSEANASETSDRTQVEEDIHSILIKYFGSFDHIQQVDIITRRYTYSMNTRTAQYEGFFSGDLYRSLAELDGGIVWLGKSEMAPYQHQTAYLSCARLLNLRYVDTSGIGLRMPDDYERAVIRVQFTDELFTNRLEKNIVEMENAAFGLIDTAGEELISGGYGGVSPMPDDIWLRILELRSGVVDYRSAEGERMIVCFDQLDQSGWISWATFSVDMLANSLSSGLYTTFLGLITVTVCTSLLAAAFAVFLVSGRINRVNHGMSSLKAGDFTTQIIDNYKDEFTPLVLSFNEMSQTLRRLIDENYKARLSEQEARIRTMLMQFNPHFLYNTLNVINWRALRESARHTSALIVSLSRTLRYTCDISRESTRFADDLEWIQQYLSLMEARFQGVFTVEWNIAPECLEQNLPKLFMQPLIENCILHGFAGMESGGVIRIRAWSEDDDVYCDVEDNGSGMSDEQATRVLEYDGGSLGLFNTHQRILLKCGDGYGLTITRAQSGGCLIRAKMRKSGAEPIRPEHPNKTPEY
jgi:two-component system sensor histidine kinase YesM